jgi:CBS domain-containing protein
MKSSNTIASVLAGKTREIWSIEPAATVYVAIEMMAARRVGALLVMSEGRLAGIVSERDYARKVILMDRSSRQCLVRDIMTSPVTTVTPNHTVDQCMQIMTDQRVRHLPVLQGHEVAGIITIGDLVKWVITSHEETIGHLQAYIAGSYPG